MLEDQLNASLNSVANVLKKSSNIGRSVYSSEMSNRQEEVISIDDSDDEENAPLTLRATTYDGVTVENGNSSSNSRRNENHSIHR